MDYFMHEKTRLENDVKQLQDNIRFRNVSTVDFLELIIAKERLSYFNEISAHIRGFINPNNNKNMKG